ncbi:MAG: sodium:proton antiporter [Gemmatimonadetes bacterium]|nr:sodium:proton antiporter [Gemmatimonadota bacterium]
MAATTFATPAVIFALALVAGMTAQVLARHLRVPGIVLLLLAGVLLGPDMAGIIQPRTLGPALRIMVAASVAVILFEGGLHLDIDRLRGEGPTIRRLVTVGVLVTGIGAALTARIVMGWTWRVAIPFGTLVTVTGPTVIGPLLRRIRVNRNLHTILEAEGVLIDPIGAILAVVALEVVLAQGLSVAAQGLLGIPTRLVVGLAFGVAGGLLIGKLLQLDLVPDGLESITALSLVLAVHALAEAVISESGILAAPIAGVIVGNMKLRPERELREFKQQLSVLLVALLFILLAADVRLAEVAALAWRGWATVLLLMFVIRPLDVAVCTRGSRLTLRERTFLSWLGPRGIVAAAVASLFAERLSAEGIAAGLELRALVFLVIAVTVVVQGMTGGVIASLLRVRRRTDSGYLIAGANPLAVQVGHALRSGGQEVVLVDTDPARTREAIALSIPAVHGSVRDEETLEEADLGGRRGVVGVIGNPATGLLLAEKARREFRIPRSFLLLRTNDAPTRAHARRVGAHVLFGRATDVAEWSRRISAGEVELVEARYDGSEQALAGIYDTAAADVLFLTISRRDRTSPVSEQTRVRTADRIALLVPRGAGLPPGFAIASGQPRTPAAAG